MEAPIVKILIIMQPHCRRSESVIAKFYLIYAVDIYP